MNGAVFVTRSLMNHLSVPHADYPHWRLSDAPDAGLPDRLVQPGRGLAAAVARMLARLRSWRDSAQDEQAQIERLAETSPHLLLDIGIDPDTRRPIPAEELSPAPAPTIDILPRDMARPRAAGRLRPARPVITAGPVKSARGWRLVPLSRKPRPARRGAGGFGT